MCCLRSCVHRRWHHRAWLRLGMAAFSNPLPTTQSYGRIAWQLVAGSARGDAIPRASCGARSSSLNTRWTYVAQTTRSSSRRGRHHHRRIANTAQGSDALALALGFLYCLTKKLSSSQPTTSPYRRTLSRVCSNAWLGLPSFTFTGPQVADDLEPSHENREDACV
jgi:hypothetical protein